MELLSGAIADTEIGFAQFQFPKQLSTLYTCLGFRVWGLGFRVQGLGLFGIL